MTTGASSASFERTGTRLRAWQAEALEAWEQAGRVGVVEAVTGTGKTQVGIEAAAGQLAAGGRALVVVPTVALLHQWHKGLMRAFPSGRVGLRGDGSTASFTDCDIVVATIHSARSLPAPGSGLIVADECHRYGSEQWFGALDPRYSARLGLSATYERGDTGDSRLAAFFGVEPVYKIGYERAIADEVVAHFRLAFLGVCLKPHEQAEYDEAESRSARAYGQLINRYGMDSENFERFMRQVAQASDGDWQLDPAGARRAAISFKHYFQKKRKVVAESRAKTQRLRDLVPVVRRAGGTLVFTQTKQAALEAADLFESVGSGAAAIYGGMRPDAREHLLSSFDAGDRRVLAAPRVLDEGIDVPDADLGIVVAASNSRRQMIQRMGRVLRRKSDGRPARFVVMFAEGTFEDPRYGMHESFIDMAVAHADTHRRFGSKASAKKIKRFLDPA